MAFKGRSHCSPAGFLLLEVFTSHLSNGGHLPDAFTAHQSLILDSGSQLPLVSRSGSGPGLRVAPTMLLYNFRLIPIFIPIYTHRHLSVNPSY